MQETVRRLEEAILKVQRQFSQELPPKQESTNHDEPSASFFDPDDNFIDDDDNITIDKNVDASKNREVKTPSPKKHDDHQTHRKRKHSQHSNQVSWPISAT